jgi:alanine racemase
VQRVTNPTIAIVDLGAIAFNLRGIRKRVGPGVKIMAIVKANAYGHGYAEVSRFVARGYADYLGVAIAEEGVQLRNLGIDAPIQVFLLPTKEQCTLMCEYGLEPTICSEREVHWLNALGASRRTTIPAHLKIDTGMNRIGVKPAQLEAFLKRLARAKRIELKGVFTHFATAEQSNKSFTLKQLDEFHRCLEILYRHGIQPPLVHCANSAAILDLPATYFSMVRPGLTMYGYYPSRTTSESIPLRPALTLKTQVGLVKRIKAGEGVSYGRRFIASRSTSIATLPVGYGDGYFRLLSGKSSVLMQGRRFPVVGAICMDQMMVDVGNAHFRAGEEAVLIGSQKRERIGAWEIADCLGTIPYEIFCAISSRVPRIYKNI